MPDGREGRGDLLCVTGREDWKARGWGLEGKVHAGLLRFMVTGSPLASPVSEVQRHVHVHTHIHAHGHAD